MTVRDFLFIAVLFLAFIKRYQHLHGLKRSILHIHPDVIFAALHLPSHHSPIDHHGLITAMEQARLIKIDTIYDSTTNKMELNIKSTYDPLSEDE